MFRIWECGQRQTEQHVPNVIILLDLGEVDIA